MKTKNLKKIDIKEQKKISFDILSFFDTICKQLNLTYFLGYGTLIGAVRHKGYIPWDDDIDVMMPRNDYNLLLELFPHHPFYEITDNSKDTNYGKSFAVINDTRTLKKEKLLRKKCVNSVCVNIDIFPLDTLPQDEKSRDILFNKVNNITKKIACITYAYGKGHSLISSIKKNLGIFIYRTMEFVSITSIRKMIEKHNELMTSYNFTESEYIGCFANIGHNGKKEILRKEYFEKTIPLEFEGKFFNVPAEYDKILTQIYGDYMTLPPEDQRMQHYSTCYWR